MKEDIKKIPESIFLFQKKVSQCISVIKMSTFLNMLDLYEKGQGF